MRKSLILNTSKSSWICPCKGYISTYKEHGQCLQMWLICGIVSKIISSFVNSEMILGAQGASMYLNIVPFTYDYIISFVSNLTDVKFVAVG